MKGELHWVGNMEIVKWPTVKKQLIKQGYQIEEKMATRHGERHRVSIITM